MKIGIVSPEAIGDAMSGIGIRMVEMGKVLSSHFEVILFVPKGSKQIKVPFPLNGYKKEAISEFLKEMDVAILQGEPANYLLSQNFKGYSIIDLYDPYCIEALSYDEKANEFAHSSLSFQLKKGNFFLCANKFQRMFYLGGLYLSKRIDPELFKRDPDFKTLIDIVPYGVPSEEPSFEKGYFPYNEPIIFFGSFYDWYDVDFLKAFLLELLKKREFHLIITKHLRPDTTPQKKFLEFYNWAEENKFLNKYIHIIDWIPYNERTKAYFSSSFAISFYPPSLETELSFRTRVLDFLYGGLPVLALKGSGLEELIFEEDGAYFVERNIPKLIEISMKILKISEEERKIFSKKIREKFSWEKVMEPLIKHLSILKIDKKEKKRFWEKILK